MPKWERRKRRWKPKPYRPQYSQAHRAKRRALAPAVEAGLPNRARCLQPILPGQAVGTLGLGDGDRLRYGPGAETVA